MGDSTSDDRVTPESEEDRRQFLSGSSIAMAAGAVAGYGTLFAMAGRFLYPAGPVPKQWVFVARVDTVDVGDSIEFEAPNGAKIVVARQAEAGTSDDFVALSSVCPHLGCQVDWQPHQNRFFCPCHNGVFTPAGEAIEGPPAAAGQSLPRYPLKAEGGLLYIEVPVDSLVTSQRHVAAAWTNDPAPSHRQPALRRPDSHTRRWEA